MSPAKWLYPSCSSPPATLLTYRPQPRLLLNSAQLADFNSEGLLAHNYLAGQHFYRLQKGQEVDLVFGDGSIKRYTISDILSFQALSPEDVYSNFIPLQGERTRMTSTDLFYQTYGLGDNLVLQTCIQVGNEPSWGRLFVIAYPVVSPVSIAPGSPTALLAGNARLQ